mmetsp:Transcript_72465/g.198547  ORF Transcript_72465/g.198547 Transcript_72465/m.198547 type:complete len:261 (+) Transcript_72465:279-1061(+)
MVSPAGTDSPAADSPAVLLVVLRRPEGEVVAEELHDERRVLVALLVERVELRDRVVEGLLGELARLRRLPLHLVQEDGVVEREAEADRVRWREARRRLRGFIVGARRTLSVVYLLLVLRELGEVAVVVGLHLEVEDAGLRAGRLRDEEVVEQSEDILADVVELLLDVGLVGGHVWRVIRMLLDLLRLDRANDAERSAARADDILVRDGQQVALLERQVRLRAFGRVLHEGDHLLVSLRLLGELGHVHFLFRFAHFCCSED